jgi:hypothetical protein
MTLLSLIFLLISDAPRHPLNRDPEAARVMASYFRESGDIYEVSPFLLVVWANGESTFRQHARGAIGEIGVMQIHGVSRDICEAVGLDVTKQRDNIECGALLMHQAKSRCGTWRRALYYYSSGKCTGTPRAKRIVARRLRQLKRFTGVTLDTR